MHVSTAHELIKFKREKFLTSIRKQKNEIVFQQKRWKPLIVSEMAQNQNLIFPRRSFDYLLQGQITSELLDHLKIMKSYFQNQKNHDYVFTVIDQIKKIASSLLNLMEDKERIQSAILDETVYKAQEILIDLTFFLDSTSILLFVQLPNFKNIFNSLSCSHYSLQTDCLTLIINIFSDLNSQERRDILDIYNILGFIIDTYLTWGVEQKFLKKALKIIQIVFQTQYKTFDECAIEDTLFMINQILQTSPDKQIELLCYKSIYVIIQRQVNSQSIVKAEIPTLLVHFLAQCTSAEENKAILNQNLVTLQVLSETSFWQFQNLINQGLPRSITNVLQLSLADDDLIFAKIIKLCAEIFDSGNYDERTSIIMDDQGDLVDVILTSINQKFKLDCELPNHTARLLNNLTNNQTYIGDVLQSLDYFRIMCVQMERFDCCETDFFSLKDWLNSIYKVLMFGKKLDCNYKQSIKEDDQFAGYFLKYNGDKIIQTLQSTNNDEIYQLCLKIMNFIE